MLAHIFEKASEKNKKKIKLINLKQEKENHAALQQKSFIAIGIN